MHRLSGSQRDLLFVIVNLDGPNGQEIMTELEQTQGREIRHARLYANLDKLANEGFVEKEAFDGRTTQYPPTEAGEREVSERFEWEREYLSAGKNT
jgi:DNA-binding PadR family transcriptional regulator